MNIMRDRLILFKLILKKYTAVNETAGQSQLNMFTRTAEVKDSSCNVQ